MRMMKDWVELIADKIRGYYFHEYVGLHVISFRGDWVDFLDGYLARASVAEWKPTDSQIIDRDESLDELVANIAKYASKDSLIGVASNKVILVEWFESEKEARIKASYVNKNKIWDCKLKEWV